MSLIEDQMICGKSQRREVLRCVNEDPHRQTTWNGIDYVEPKFDPISRVVVGIRVGLLCPSARNWIEKDNVRISDQRGMIKQCIIAVEPGGPRDIYLRVENLGQGTYWLTLYGLTGVDPRFTSSSFQIFNPVLEIDPAAPQQCPPAPSRDPQINYLARDYQSFRQLILDRISLIMPDWKERHAADIGMTLVELLAYIGDHLSYYQDAVGTEAYLGTARSRISVRRHARLVDYTLHEGCNARTFMALTVARDITIDPRDVYFTTRLQNPELQNKRTLAHHELQFENTDSYVGFEIQQIPPQKCGLEEWRCLNWVGFLAWLTAPADDFCLELCTLLAAKLVEEIRAALRMEQSKISDELIQKIVAELRTKTQQLAFWQLSPGFWSIVQVAAAVSAYASSPSNLAGINLGLLQLRYPQFFSMCRSLDACDEDDGGASLSLMFADLRPRRLSLYESHNRMRFYTWDQSNCCLPKGATSATLVDHDFRPYDEIVTDCSRIAQRLTWPRKLNLRPGDLLLIQEVLGPKTGSPYDADPSRRQVVRLTRVNYSLDPVRNLPIVEVEWSHEDKLLFPFCVSSVTTGPDCRLIQDVSVAFGNVVLADQGIRIQEPELVDTVPAAKLSTCCAGSVCGGTVRKREQNQVMEFRLDAAELTYAVPVMSCQSAATLLQQKPHKALPAIEVKGIPVDPSAERIHEDQPRTTILSLIDLESPEQLVNKLPQMSQEAIWTLLDELPPDLDDFVTNFVEAARTGKRPVADPKQAATLLEVVRQKLRWQPCQHLMDSRSDDQHFAIEMDNDRRTQLRFGNGDQGKLPPSEMVLWASYRVGNGPVGNIGQEKLFHVVYRNTPITGIHSIRNPLPASGGTDAESSQHAKLHAPHAFRTLQRAILQDDYRDLVMRDFPLQVQQARATLQQVGTRSVITVVIDPASEVRDVKQLLKTIKAKLDRYKRMGHEVDVREPDYVGLDIRLKVTTHSGYLKGQIHKELMALFGIGLLVDGRKAFFHPDNLTFGDSIYLSRIVAEAKKVSGVANVIVDRLARQGEDETTAKQHLNDGVLTLGPFEIPAIANNASAPGSGQIVITMEGGR